jgi:hypothetical protein
MECEAALSWRPLCFVRLGAFSDIGHANLFFREPEYPVVSRDRACILSNVCGWTRMVAPSKASGEHVSVLLLI